MLELEEVTVEYGAGNHAFRAVDRVSLVIPTGATLGLVGESGSGKSTAARATVGLVSMSSGRVMLDGERFDDSRALRSNAYRARVQIVFQNPYASLNPRMTIGSTLTDAVTAARPRLKRRDRRGEVVRILSLVGLGEHVIERYPHQFSGGQRQRIAIARALAVRPEVLILDEVASALDVSVQAAILNLLRDLQRELGLSYLMISHDLAVVSAVSDTAAVMYAGRIVESGTTADVLRLPQHPYTRLLVESVPQFGRAPTTPDDAAWDDAAAGSEESHGCHFRSRCPVGPSADPTKTICMTVDPHNGSEQRVHHAACHFAPSESTAP